MQQPTTSTPLYTTTSDLLPTTTSAPLCTVTSALLPTTASAPLPEDDLQPSLSCHSSQHSRRDPLAIYASQGSDQMSLCEDPVIEIPDSPEPNITQSQRPVTVTEFEFYLSQVDEKINSLYKLCLHFDERQQEILKGIKKLVALTNFLMDSERY